MGPIIDIKLKLIQEHMEKLQDASSQKINQITANESLSDQEKQDQVKEVNEEAEKYKKLYIGKNENGELPYCMYYDVMKAMPDICNADHAIGVITRFATECSEYKQIDIEEETDQVLAIFGIKKEEKTSQEEKDILKHF